MMNLEKIISFCKQKGLIYQSSEIYGGINGFFDYGPMGVEIKNNIKNFWWNSMIYSKHGIMGLDTSIIKHPLVWKNSGHIKNFSDFMIDCKESKKRYRIDLFHFAYVKINNICLGFVSIFDSVFIKQNLAKESLLLKSLYKINGDLRIFNYKTLNNSLISERRIIPSPENQMINSLSEIKEFNLMFKTNIGSIKNQALLAFLRPETAQGIFINFRNIINTYRINIPFGVAQIGKSFRNEITPRNFIFRSREFEQMEIEIFEKQTNWEEVYYKWIEISFNWLIKIGLRKALLSLEEYNYKNLAHYAKTCVDIQFDFPFGKQELEGIAVRGFFDLYNHQKASKVNFQYYDISCKKYLFPYIIEPSMGLDRLFLAIICSSYSEDKIKDNKRIFLKINPYISPIKIAIFPIVKNNIFIINLSKFIYMQLKNKFKIIYDEVGAIGKRYRRMDEIGTPFCITIDFLSLKDKSITIRNRDTTKQVRISIYQMVYYFETYFYLL